MTLSAASAMTILRLGPSPSLSPTAPAGRPDHTSSHSGRHCHWDLFENHCVISGVARVQVLGGHRIVPCLPVAGRPAAGQARAVPVRGGRAPSAAPLLGLAPVHLGYTDHSHDPCTTRTLIYTYACKPDGGRLPQ
jgi:hypothetical protein